MAQSAIIERESTGLRERKRLATRTAISDEARRLAAEHGFSHFTVGQLCEEVGISRRTFFNYFPSKEDALLGSEEGGIPTAVAEEFVRKGESSPAGRLSVSLVDDLVDVTCSLFEAAPLSAAQFALLLKAIHKDSNLLVILFGRAEEWEGMLKGLIAAREGMTTADPRVVMAAVLISSVMQRAGREYFSSVNTRGYREIFTEYVDAARALLR